MRSTDFDNITRDYDNDPSLAYILKKNVVSVNQRKMKKLKKFEEKKEKSKVTNISIVVVSRFYRQFEFGILGQNA